MLFFNKIVDFSETDLGIKALRSFQDIFEVI